jgi:hypothetical protein
MKSVIRLTFAASLLFDTINNPVALLVTTVSPQTWPIFMIALVHIITLALFAPIPQPIFAGALYAELTLFFPLFALGTTLHFAPHPLCLGQTATRLICVLSISARVSYRALKK